MIGVTGMNEGTGMTGMAGMTGMNTTGTETRLTGDKTWAPGSSSAIKWAVAFTWGEKIT